jgi:hypothetical protein
VSCDEPLAGPTSLAILGIERRAWNTICFRPMNMLQSLPNVLAFAYTNTGKHMATQRHDTPRETALMDSLNLSAAILCLLADIQFLIDLCRTIAHQAGIDKIDGVSVVEWICHHRTAKLRRLLEDMDTISPTLAAIIQQRIVEANKAMEELVEQNDRQESA